MKRKGNKPEEVILRQKAEELLKKKLSKTSSFVSENSILKLNHELEVHQIELEIQNEELTKAKEQANIVAQKYVELYNNAPSGYFTLSKEGEIIELNPCGANILGKGIKQLRGSMIGFFVSNETRPIFASFLKRVFEIQGEESCEITLSIDDNLPMYVYLNGIAHENGDLCFVNAINITDRKLAEDLIIANKELAFKNEMNEIRATELLTTNKELKQLIQLNADKDLFISILAHDLRSPFNALLNLSELLKSNINQKDISEIENIGNLIYKSAQSTYGLLEDILMWARAQSGNIPFNPKQLSLSDICKDILEAFNSSADAKNISITCSSIDVVNVFGDADMLKAVFRNLVSNAIKFTNKHGQIDIYPELNQTNVTIIVSDTGVGIHPDTLVKLFDVSQISSTNGTAAEKGTGLGLVLCKQFIERHGGKIWAESEFGKGSKFKFTLPLSDSQMNDLRL